MKLIERIEISYFRSFAETAKAEDCSDLNIFSGSNDTGKSNILRALNLFFTHNKVDFYNLLNFENDFSKRRKKKVAETLKAKRLFKIRILFNKLKSSGTVLPETFWVEKTWDIDGVVKRKTKNKIGLKLKTPQQEAATTRFLKKIHFFYVPAIKSKEYFDFLKEEYQKSLANVIENISNVDKSEKRNFEEWSKTFSTGEIRNLLSKKINYEAEKMLTNFKQSTPEINDSFIAIPKLDFAKSLQFQTDDDIPLSNRGDGVQAKFIPHILNEISKNNKSPLVIWGFEEPENSYEYSNAEKLADEFLKKHCIDNQIFLTTHSFNFVTIIDDKVSQYRVVKKDNTSRIIRLYNKIGVLSDSLDSNQDDLFDEIGVTSLLRELKDLYSEKKDVFEQLKKIKENAEEEDKVQLLTEGTSDVEFITILLNKYFQGWQKECKFIDPKSGLFKGIGKLKSFLKNFSMGEPSSKYIVIFDNDDAGYKAYTQLPEKLHENTKAIILPDLDWAKNWDARVLKSNDKTIANFDLNRKALPIEMYFWNLFEKDFSDDERIFEYNNDIVLPDSIKKELQIKIRQLKGDEENDDGKKIVDLIKSTAKTLKNS